MFNIAAKLDSIRNAAANAVNFRGNKDFIEGVAAAVSLVANADGTVSDDEVKMAIEVMSSNRALQAAGFTERDVTTQLDIMLPKGKTFTGKLALKKELEEARARDTTGELSQTIVAVALDVAAADNDIGEKEMAVLKDIAAKLRVDLGQFGL